MPLYEYEHLEASCPAGRVIEVRQSLRERPLRRCPHCGGQVRKIISRANFNLPKSDREIRDLGFTKLVRREDGVYENVTARSGESKVMERGRPETIPDFGRAIGD
ncbi:MAG: zinc ribbon domain-containing protein [Thermodesulfobacteriota bacterium]